MLSPDELRRLLTGCRQALRAAEIAAGEPLCAAALHGATPGPDALPALVETAAEGPGSGCWASLLHAPPAALVGIALAWVERADIERAGTESRATPGTGRLAIALQARLTGCVQADDLATGAGVLHAALVAGLGCRPTVSRALDLLPLAALPGGGFGPAFLGTGTVDGTATLRCTWAMAEAYRPGVTRLLTGLPSVLPSDPTAPMAVT